MKLFLNLTAVRQQQMNFQRDEPFDRQLAHLLALVVLFERKIQNLRKKLAGNEDFHTRLVFQKLDFRKKGQCNPEDLLYILSDRDRTINLLMCQNFCRKYSTSGAINYNQFLKILSPKTDAILTQRLMMRTAKRGTTLPQYLWQHLQQLLSNMITMTNLTENIRKSIQISSELSYLEMVQFFKKCLNTPNNVYRFCNQNSDEGFDFTQDYIKYLSLYIRSGNDIQEMDDEDIKELICPIQLNFSKPVLEMASHYETLKHQMKKTINPGTKAQQMYPTSQKTQTNFLNVTYQKTRKEHLCENQPINIQKGFQQKQRKEVKPELPSYRRPNINDEPSTSQMYLDNFMKPSTSGRARIDLDNFLSKRKSTEGEKFIDQLQANLDSELDQSQSAFYHY